MYAVVGTMQPIICNTPPQQPMQSINSCSPISKIPKLLPMHIMPTDTKERNGIPDIIDEAKWGLDWLNRMNPAKGELYNQIADDRDHAGMRLPNKDLVDYGYGPGKGRAGLLLQRRTASKRHLYERHHRCGKHSRQVCLLLCSRCRGTQTFLSRVCTRNRSQSR